MRLRAIIELDTEKSITQDAQLAGLSGQDLTDALTDNLVGAFGPDVQVTDIVEETEPAWHRTSRF